MASRGCPLPQCPYLLLELNLPLQHRIYISAHAASLKSQEFILFYKNFPIEWLFRENPIIFFYNILYQNQTLLDRRSLPFLSESKSACSVAQDPTRITNVGSMVVKPYGKHGRQMLRHHIVNSKENWLLLSSIKSGSYLATAYDLSGMLGMQTYGVLLLSCKITVCWDRMTCKSLIN